MPRAARCPTMSSRRALSFPNTWSSSSRAFATSRIRPSRARRLAVTAITHWASPGWPTSTTWAIFRSTDSRELTADDYVYGLKRLAHPRLHSPILGLMSEYIVGLDDFGQGPPDAPARPAQGAPRRMAGPAPVPSRRCRGPGSLSYRIRVKGKYPQFVYWLTMPFFAPMPWEADQFHGQPGMAEKNLTLDWYPIGTGPYMLTENNPNARMVLERNPNFHGEAYPCEGESGDRAAGLLADCGQALPFVDESYSPARRSRSPTGTSSCRATTMPRRSLPTPSIRRCKWAAAARRR